MLETIPLVHSNEKKPLNLKIELVKNQAGYYCHCVLLILIPNTMGSVYVRTSLINFSLFLIKPPLSLSLCSFIIISCC